MPNDAPPIPVLLRNGRIERSAGWALAVLVAALTLAILSTTLTVTRAAPVEESAAAERLWLLHPTLWRAGALAGLAAALLCAAAAARDLRAGARRAAAAAGLAGALALSGALPFAAGILAGWRPEALPIAGSRTATGAFGAALLAGLLLAVRAHARLAVRSAPGGDLAAAAARLGAAAGAFRVLPRLPALLLTGMVGAAVANLPAILRGIAAGTEFAGGFLPALLLSLAGTALFALLFGAALAAFLTVAAAAARRWPARAASCFGVLAGLFVAAFFGFALHFAVGPAIEVLGLRSVAATALLLAGSAGSVFAARALLVPEAGRGRRRAAWTIALVLLLAGFTSGLWPSMEDFLDRMRFVNAASCVLAGMLLGCLWFPPRSARPGRRAAAAALLAAGAVAVLLASRGGFSQGRPRVFLHEPVGKYGLWIAESLLPTHGDAFGERGAPLPVPLGGGPTDRRTMDLVETEPDPLIVFVLWDGVRRDRMGLFGYRRPGEPPVSTTPFLDRRRDEYVRFPNVIAPSTATSCSVRHLFTGRYSSRYMLKSEGLPPFFTEDLAQAGYDTFLLNLIGSDYNGIGLPSFVRGTPSAPPGALVVVDEQDERKAAADIVRRLAERGRDGRGAFAFLHIDATHMPWNRFPAVPDFGSSMADRYDQTIVYADLVTEELTAGLAAHGLLEKAIVAIFADHGVGLGEHGVYGGFHPWRALLSVPLLVRVPGLPGHDVPQLSGIVDLAPTVVDLVRPAGLARFEGRSLWPLLLRAGDPAAFENRTFFGLSAFDDCFYLADSRGRHYVRHLRERYEQLLDWRNDPDDRRNLVGEDEATTEEVRRVMDWFLHVHGAGRDYLDPDFYTPPR